MSSITSRAAALVRTWLASSARDPGAGRERPHGELAVTLAAAGSKTGMPVLKTSTAVAVAPAPALLGMSHHRSRTAGHRTCTKARSEVGTARQNSHVLDAFAHSVSRPMK